MVRRFGVSLALLLTLLIPAWGQEVGEAEIRAFLKAPITKATGTYTTPDTAAKLRALLKANPRLVDQPIYQLRGQDISTPLVEALKLGNVDAARALLDFKAKPNLALGEWPIIPLQAAMTARLPGEVRLTQVRLLLAAGATPTNGLHIWAEAQGWSDTTYFAAADALVQAKAGVNVTDDFGATPLLVAVVNDNVMATEKLLSLGAKVDEDVQRACYAANWVNPKDPEAPKPTPQAQRIFKLLKLKPF